MDSIISPSTPASISMPSSSNTMNMIPSMTAGNSASHSIPSIPEVTSEWPSISHSPHKSSVSSWGIWDILKIFLIVIIISALGFNVFSYLSRGTDYLSDIVKNITGYLPAGLAKTLNLSVAGTKLATDVVAGSIQDVGKIVTEIPEAEIGKFSHSSDDSNEKTSDFQNELWKTRDKKLSDAVNNGTFASDNKYPQHEPDKSSSSSIQNPNSKSWCYVGTDRNYRSCVQVKNSTECMSGKVYPSKQICINPTLRE